MKTWVGAVLALGVLLTAGAHAEDCRLHIVTALPMVRLDSNRVAVDAAIGGKKVQFLVDTGAPFSVLTRSTVKRLGLKERVVSLDMHYDMFGGERLRDFVRAFRFQLGAMHVRRVEFLVMKDGRDDYDGLLGADFLSQFDVDFDFAGRKINLFRPHPCAGKAVYWTKDDAAVARIPFESERDDPHIKIPVRIDGEKVRAVIDTGASHSAMNLETAERLFGLNETSPGMRTANGSLGTVYFYPFKTVTFEGVTVNHPMLVLFPRDRSHFKNDRMLLGITVLRKLHLFVAYQERMLYVTAADKH